MQKLQHCLQILGAPASRPSLPWPGLCISTRNLTCMQGTFLIFISLSGNYFSCFSEEFSSPQLSYHSEDKLFLMYGLVLGQNGKANLVPADADSQLDIPREQQGWDAKPSSASPQLWAPGFARCRLPPAVSAGKAELGAEQRGLTDKEPPQM